MILLNNLSNRFAKYLSTIVPNSKYPSIKDQIEVYDFAIKGVFEELSTMILLILFSLVLGVFTPVIFIALTFISLRSIAGGIHLSTHRRCQIMSIVMFIGSGLIMKLILRCLSIQNIYFLLLFCVLTTLYMVVRYIPRDSINKPITDPLERLKFKRLSLYYIIIWTIIMTIFLHLNLKIIVIASCFGLLLELFNCSKMGQFISFISDS